jgi:hypothetical protein
VRKAAMLLLLAAVPASCQPDTVDKKESARTAFEDWVRACAEGDAAKVFHGLSDGNKSGWVYERLEESDALARRWRGDLTGLARTDLDLWLGVAKKRADGRQEPLPQTVLTHPSLKTLFTELFTRDAGAIKLQMSRLAVAQVYGDDSGVTVAVKNGLGSTELYGMVYERDGWKIDAHRQPLSGGR